MLIHSYIILLYSLMLFSRINCSNAHALHMSSHRVDYMWSHAHISMHSFVITLDRLYSMLTCVCISLGMTISTRLAGTRPGSTLMGWVLPGPIRNRVGFGSLKKKTRSESGLGPGFIKKTRNQTRPDPFKTRYPKLLKYPLYI